MDSVPSIDCTIYYVRHVSGIWIDFIPQGIFHIQSGFYAGGEHFLTNFYGADPTFVYVGSL